MNRSCHRYWLGVISALTLTGCQALSLPPLFTGGDAFEENTLATLQPATLEQAGSARENVNLDEVVEGYEALLPLLDDPEDIVRVQHRLADLRFQQAENRLVDQAVVDLDVAIAAYQGLLEKYPQRASNDQVLYQLAKAHDLNGDTAAYLETLNRLVDKYPASDLYVEAQFRRGEVLFSNYEFEGAEQAFAAVIRADNDAPGKQTFIANAYYMKGWCQFKQSDYENALLSYISVLDLVMPEAVGAQGIGAQNRTLVEDLFRVMGLSFSYLDGADSVAALFERTGSKPYEILVYDRYSELLLEKELYSDAIDVYQRYIDIHPFSQWAPRYHMNIIGTLELAGFRAEIPAKKAEFADTYGITGDYWLKAGVEGRRYALDQLELVLPELANRHYVLAQRADEQSEINSQYRNAARYYGEFADTFPNHENTPDMLFLLGETRLELEQWRRAIDAFERVAYDFPANSQAAEAAYASVLTYNRLAETWPANPVTEPEANRELQQQSRLRFVSAFPEDERAIGVLYVAVQFDFQQQAYPAVIERAQQIIDWQPSPEPDLLLEARLLKAHSHYALGDYPQAEIAYQDALLILPPGDSRLNGVIENLAASVYRQAEALLIGGNKAAAVDEFLRVGAVAPTSALRANAEYDAANTVIELADWDRAIVIITGFRERYPDHEMIDTLPAKMALAYRETEQWELAADELQTLFELADTDEEKRETLLIAAELYDRAGSRNKAIETYRTYANTYQAPLDAYMESANRLAELYEQEGDTERYQLWLNRQMKAVDENRDQIDDRMLYLAAGASSVLAKDALNRYNAIALTLPLERTMADKVQALETAVRAYQKTASYGVSSYSTEAGYYIADIYARLGSDLMEAEHPEGLSELEQMQYDLLLEEQAFPFEEKAIDIHEQNASRSWSGIYDGWVKRSFDELEQLMPARYNKPELTAEVVNELD